MRSYSVITSVVLHEVQEPSRHSWHTSYSIQLKEGIRDKTLINRSKEFFLPLKNSGILVESIFSTLFETIFCRYNFSLRVITCASCWVSALSSLNTYQEEECSCLFGAFDTFHWTSFPHPPIEINRNTLHTTLNFYAHFVQKYKNIMIQ